ncbi:MAG: VanZ family protein, partial [Thermomicrobiales bacterium]
MSTNEIIGPGIVAVILGAILSILLLVPMIARQYRHWGTLSVSRLFLILAFMLYLVAIPMYTLLPQGINIDAFCQMATGPRTQLVPFRFLKDINAHWTGFSPGDLIANVALQQVVLNVILFVPLGIFLRKLNGFRAWAVLQAGLGTSVLIELTQLTGNWGLSECAYRVFDVDDILINTFGTLIGLALSPILELFPGVRLNERDRQRIRPINRTRRLVQLFCDWLLFTLGAQGLSVIAIVFLSSIGVIGRAESRDVLSAMITLAVGVVLFVIVPIVTHGETLGERIVLISVKTRDGRDPGLGPILIKSAAGWGGFVVLATLSSLGFDWANIAIAVVIVVALGFLLASPEGLSIKASGLRRYDDRV